MGPRLVVHVVLEPAGARGVTELVERLALDLADALARDAELAADLLERAGVSVLEAEAELDDLALAVREAEPQTGSNRFGLAPRAGFEPATR